MAALKQQDQTSGRMRNAWEALARERIDRSSFVPPYYQLAQIIERHVRSGDFGPGDMLPPEAELASMFGISRMTVRKSIEKLAQLGLVTASQGRGTFVNQPPLEYATFSLPEFAEDMRARGLRPSCRLLEAKVMRAPAEVANKLNLDPGRRVLFVRRLLYADDEPMVYDRKYLRYDRGQPILEAELEYMNLPAVMARHSDVLPSDSRFVVRVTRCSRDEAALLGVDPDSPVFQVEQFIHSADGSPVGWGILVYRGDRYYFASLPRLLR
ncbi:MAG: GntR family transcriptional regulator [Bacillota bacterium]